MCVLTLVVFLPRCLVDKLNDLRDSEQGPHVPNRLDTLLADVFSLLSLFFLTIGKGRECPATYSQIASMRVSVIPCFCFTWVLGVRAGVPAEPWHIPSPSHLCFGVCHGTRTSLVRNHFPLRLILCVLHIQPE